MKKYQALQISITVFPMADLLRTSGVSEYEGVSDLNPTTRQDWFM